MNIKCWFGRHDFVEFKMPMPDHWVRGLIGHRCSRCGRPAPGQEAVQTIMDNIALTSRPLFVMDEYSAGSDNYTKALDRALTRFGRDFGG